MVSSAVVPLGLRRGGGPGCLRSHGLLLLLIVVPLLLLPLLLSTVNNAAQRPPLILACRMFDVGFYSSHAGLAATAIAASAMAGLGLALAFDLPVIASKGTLHSFSTLNALTAAASASSAVSFLGASLLAHFDARWVHTCFAISVSPPFISQVLDVFILRWICASTNFFIYLLSFRV